MVQTVLLIFLHLAGYHCLSSRNKPTATNVDKEFGVQFNVNFSDDDSLSDPNYE